MTITISVPDQLALQAAGHGLSVEAFVEQLAQQAATLAVSAAKHPAGLPSVAAAVDHIRESRRGLMLGGGFVSKDLVHEGHKY